MPTPHVTAAIALCCSAQTPAAFRSGAWSQSACGSRSPSRAAAAAARPRVGVPSLQGIAETW